MTDEKLAYAGRSLRTYPGHMLLGSTGKRLFADFLEKRPGFTGSIDFIHKTGILSLFEIKCSEPVDWEEAKYIWYPDHSVMELESDQIAFSESKFITLDDCAVSEQTWKNKTSHPVLIFLCVPETPCQKENLEGFYTLVFPESVHGYQVGAVVAASEPVNGEPFVLSPGETKQFVFLAAVGNLKTESLQSLYAKSERYRSETRRPLERQREEYNAFMQEIPSFHCSNELLNHTWDYRWFILRHNLSKPDFGRLQGYVMYEGRSHKNKGTPFGTFGWEFSKLINLSTPLHIMDMRWCKNKEYLYDMIQNMVDSVDENGCFCSSTVDEPLSSYANFGIWAVYQFWLINKDKAFIRELLPKLKKIADCETKTYGSTADSLQIERRHNKTGKEYQPSYWYFHQFPQNPKNPETYTPLKRVDRSVYHYKNILAVAELCTALGDLEAESYLSQAEKIKDDIRRKMWDKETSFFYDLHYLTDEKAWVKNIVGIYPFWADITGSEHLNGLEKLFDERYFYTPCPFPSVARDCEAYRPGGGWMDQFIKGRNGCVWCGPSWPYTTGIALDAIGLQSLRHAHCYDRQFGECLKKYAQQHFNDHNLERPYLVEHYNAETGEPISDEPDYNHSYFIDLIIQYIAGVHVKADGISFEPLDIGLDYFVLSDLEIAGEQYKITYRARDCGDPYAKELMEGYHVFKNGAEVKEVRNDML